MLAHNRTSTRHNTTEVKNMTTKAIPRERTVTIGKTTYNVNRKFGTRSLEDLMLEHMLANNSSAVAFDAGPAL